MKKKMLFIALIFSCVYLHSQTNETLFPVNPDTGEIYYSEVIKVNGKSKDDLFLSAKVWFVNTFNSSNDVVQLIDKKEGMIIGKGIYKLKKGAVSFSVKIIVKEERYKYEVYDFSYEAYYGGNFDLNQKNPKKVTSRMWPNTWKKERNSTLNNTLSLIKSLIKGVSSVNTGVKNDDW
jgi:hypothetical protein